MLKKKKKKGRIWRNSIRQRFTEEGSHLNMSKMEAEGGTCSEWKGQVRHSKC